MNIAVFGAGHIGLTTSLCFAELGHQVMTLDIDAEKIKNLQSGITEIYELGLKELLTTQLAAGTIRFTTDLQKTIAFSDLIFIAVGTPTLPGANCDMQHVNLAVQSITKYASNPKQLVIKSTVPPGTNARFAQIYAHLNHQFIANPEFLREGSALLDCRKPDRAVIGTLDPAHIQNLRVLYQPFLNTQADFLVMDPTSAELTKYAANAMLASRVSLMNEFSKICEKVGADIDCLRTGIGADQRIGTQFLKAGIGYGGSCFPKDIDALIQFAECQNVEVPLTKAIRSANDHQLMDFKNKIVSHFSSRELEKRVAIWGASFKPETNDLREAPALKLVQGLLVEGFAIQIYDPVSQPALKLCFKDEPKVQVFENQYQALSKAEALIIATEWPQFIGADLAHVKQKLNSAVIFDGRNIFSKAQMEKHQFMHYPVGRGPCAQS